MCFFFPCNSVRVNISIITTTDKVTHKTVTPMSHSQIRDLTSMYSYDELNSGYPWQRKEN